MATRKKQLPAAQSQTAQVKPNAYPSPGPIGNTSGLVIPDTAPNLHGATAPAIKPMAQEKSWWQRWGSDVVHTGLDVVGLIPGVGEIADGANALIYLAEGDKVNAALSAAAMIPGAGMAATGAKYGKKAAAAATEAVGKKAGREAAEAGSQKATKEAEEAAAKKADGQGGGKDKGKPKKHELCGKRSTYNKAPKKLGELNADHVPSGGALKQAAKDLLVEKGIWDSLSEKQQKSVLNRVYNNAPTITVPEDIHKEGRTYGSKNKPLIQGDSKGLKDAFKRDTEAIRKAMEGKDHGCLEEYMQSVEELKDFDFDKYVKDMALSHKAVKPKLPST